MSTRPRTRPSSRRCWSRTRPSATGASAARPSATRAAASASGDGAATVQPPLSVATAPTRPPTASSRRIARRTHGHPRIRHRSLPGASVEASAAAAPGHGARMTLHSRSSVPRCINLRNLPATSSAREAGVVTGVSGSGKSTLVRLVLQARARFADLPQIQHVALHHAPSPTRLFSTMLQ